MTRTPPRLPWAKWWQPTCAARQPATGRRCQLRLHHATPLRHAVEVGACVEYWPPVAGRMAVGLRDPR